ncbi:uncharacterized protein PG998_004181 [Apiospora kogelbergensis]|uniref:uncharacterized protein n=1 Tax=Apiospora kogelbergensis TaxID=1337665 RepID=UPI0031304C85
MSEIQSASLANISFKWETNDMINIDENTPYLDRKADLLGLSNPMNEPLEEFLDLPNHSGDKHYLPGLFQPLCSNQSIAKHRSERIQTLGQSIVWLHDSSYDQNAYRDYSGVMDSTKFLSCLRMKSHPKPHARYSEQYHMHGNLEPSIRAKGPSEDENKAFVMELHLPYLVWRDRGAESNREDERRSEDGSPLRKRQDLSFLARAAKSDCCNRNNMPRGYLYEAQSSCVVTGYNHSYWTAISFSDTYFYLGADTNDPQICGDNEDMLPYYAGDDMDEATDPLTLDSSQVRLRTHDPRWVIGVMSLLKKFQVTLEKAIKISKNFEQFELVKITGLEPTKMVLPYIEGFRHCIIELEIIHDKLIEMSHETQLFRDQFVLHQSVAGNYVTVMQQATFATNYNQIMFFGAPTLAASLFQANVFGGVTIFVLFLLVTAAIVVLKPVAQTIWGKFKSSYLWNLLAMAQRIIPTRIVRLSVNYRIWPALSVFRIQRRTTLERQLPLREPEWNGVGCSGIMTVPDTHSSISFVLVEHSTRENRCIFTLDATTVWKKDNFVFPDQLGGGIRPDLVEAQMEIHKEVVETMVDTSGRTGTEFCLNRLPQPLTANTSTVTSPIC